MNKNEEFALIETLVKDQVDQWTEGRFVDLMVHPSYWQIQAVSFDETFNSEQFKRICEMLSLLVQQPVYGEVFTHSDSDTIEIGSCCD